MATAAGKTTRELQVGIPDWEEPGVTNWHIIAKEKGMIVPQINRAEVFSLTPSNCFIAIAKTVGDEFHEYDGFRGREMQDGGNDFMRLRNLVTGLFRSGRVREESLVIYTEPFLRDTGGGYALARFWLDCYWEEADVEVQFFCLLVTGSPKNNLPYTAILQSVEIQKMVQRGKHGRA